MSFIRVYMGNILTILASSVLPTRLSFYTKAVFILSDNFETASLEFDISKISQISLATNHISPSIITVLTFIFFQNILRLDENIAIQSFSTFRELLHNFYSRNYIFLNKYNYCQYIYFVFLKNSI